MMRWSVVAVTSANLLGCNYPAPPDDTGGVQVDTSTTCGHALLVAESDYVSTALSAFSGEGTVLSPIVISSGSSSTGASSALSGDVVLASSTPQSGEIVLVDRYPNSVITWLTPGTGLVRAQLQVATGFPANPHDYLDVSATKAYVTRYNTNPSPGRMPFDGGGDLLVIDPQSAKIVGRIDLAEPGDLSLLPRPDRMVRVGTTIIVSLQRFASDYTSLGAGRLVAVDTLSDSVLWKVDLPGLANCSGLALAPSGGALAVACSGKLGMDGPALNDDSGGIALIDLSATPPSEAHRYLTRPSLAGPPGPSIAFASSTILVGTTFGNLDVGVADTAFTVDIVTGRLEPLATASTAFVMGDVRCCDSRCFLADAGTNAIRIWDLADGALRESDPIRMPSPTGLPPRYLGAF